MRHFPKLIVLGALALGAAGCGTTQLSAPSARPAPGIGRIETPSTPLECVTFARAESGIGLRGDAYTWWDQANGRYVRQPMPETGAVLVLTGYAGKTRGHLLVVRKQVSPRLIRVDHANWLNDGRVYLDNPVADVSAANDWSQVRVYNLRDGGWGLKTYRAQGFITARPGSDAPRYARVDEIAKLIQSVE